MVKNGLLNRIGKDIGAALHKTDRLAVSEIESLKTEVRKRATLPQPAMVSIHRAAAVTKISRDRVLKMVLDGDLANVAFDATGDFGIFRSILVDISELDSRAARRL